MNSKELALFYSKYQKKLEEPIVQQFLKDPKNHSLFIKAIEEPTSKNKQLLDEAFKLHFKKVKMLSYISKLIYFYSIDFDKKVTLNKNRNLLTLDKTITSDENNNTTMLEVMNNDLTDRTCKQFEENQIHLKEHITDELLYKALDLLTEKQLHILNLYYVHEYNNKQISRILSESEQTISYNHKKALEKLKSQLI
ncbi:MULTISPECIES: sigma-70 family RNA polymerase sigma factor [unclassified Bacillus (in: firmicutes)]|uniref:Sigma-70 family RNA polymerase sigma factor n=1 Tax=Bacillus bruguierae TaxID=3127667 RepID=A0ABU8FMR0_9BACI|nr:MULTISPECIES: sigma-70 family RNA polymerase sigma factor [unclassified Bacillus (in: firmicutes)]SFK05005.1 RNA polymerase sigma factor, sigma-70 family [Bacillus sp. 71mf]SFT22665.1 RNA polymerase sigma factor, sigma-70 family [Bacillus sp. 103mf]